MLKGISAATVLRVTVQVFIVACCVALIATRSTAQTGAVRADDNEREVTALMVSDIHFEPFWDPAKAVQLASAPADQWSAILAAPESPDRAARFAAVEQACHTRGEDTTFALLQSSLRAMKAHAADAKFVTVSGDLISHAFNCKFGAAFPQAAPADYQAFAEKTVAFVVGSLRTAFPGVPVYVALGNNDSGCGDYQLDANSDFLRATGEVIAADLPAAEKKQAEQDFAAGGYFSVRLPAPFVHARLLVLDDLFMSRRYETCAGKPDPSAADAQIAWLKKQLSDARQNGERIWVMAHIPPGVDPYSTATKGKNICKGKEPTMFLSSEVLPETIAGYGDVINLAIFAHTHMDELRLLEPAKRGDEERGVAVKMVSSISPIDGNNPSFTVARIDLGSAVMKDYRVYVASNQTGIDATWAEEYDYAKTYQESAFAAPELKNLITKFAFDTTGQSSASKDFMRNYSPGASLRELQEFWPQYVCALKNDAGEAFASCACAATP